MADGHFPTLVSKDRNANAIANGIFVHISDGTDQLAVNADGSLNVTVTGGASNTQFAEDTAHVTGDIGTEMLSVRRDTPVSGTSADGDYATINTDADGRVYVNIHDGGNSITVDGTVAVSSVAGNVTVVQPTGTNLHVVVDSGAITVSATDLDIRDLTHVSDSVKVGDGTDFLAVNADGSINAIVTATDLDIRNLTLALDAVKVSGNATANSELNPLWVKEGAAVSGTEVQDYDTSAAVAADTADNHDYTVAGTTFLLKSVIAAFSGGGKVEVQVGPVASLVSKAVAFVSKEGGHVQLNFDPAIEVTGLVATVRVIRTNRQGQAQDVYSTIIGHDLA